MKPWLDSPMLLHCHQYKFKMNKAQQCINCIKKQFSLNVNSNEKTTLMKNKITLSLVLLLSLSLSPTFGQIFDNDDKTDVNSSASYDSIERKKTFELRLDSLVGKRGENGFILRWNYEKNKITEEVFEIVDNSTSPMEKTVRIYNDRDLINLEFKYTWKEELSKYLPKTVMNGSKTEFIYDDNGNNLFQYQYFWSTDQETYLPYDKEEFKYDEQGRKILRLWYTWNSEFEKFDSESKTEYKYDLVGKIIESYSYDYQSYKNVDDEFFLENKSTFTYSVLLDEQYRKVYRWDNDLKKMKLSNNGEVRYSFKENKKFSPKDHFWLAEVLKNKHENKRVIYAPNFIKLCENDISTARISSNREYRYDNYGICVLYNRFSVHKVTNTGYKSNVRARKSLIDDKKNLIYHYTDSDYDLDFHNWEIDREWIEYYSKIEK